MVDGEVGGDGKELIDGDWKEVVDGDVGGDEKRLEGNIVVSEDGGEKTR